VRGDSNRRVQDVQGQEGEPSRTVAFEPFDGGACFRFRRRDDVVETATQRGFHRLLEFIGNGQDSADGVILALQFATLNGL
jgi:hypothetical protein